LKKLSVAIHGLLLCLAGLTPNFLWAAPPNVVLSHALHFSSSEGTSVTLGPGKYFVEQAGPSALRLTPEGNKPGITIQAESLTHEQYELFSPMALTRPQKDDEYLIELLLPGGIRLGARGSTKAPPDPPKIVNAPAAAPSLPSVQETEIPVTVPIPEFIPPQTPREDRGTSLPLPSQPSSLDNSLPYRAPDLFSQGMGRIVVDVHEPEKEPLYLTVLSPDHIGLTMFEQPALFWFIAHLTSQHLDVVITDEGNTQRLLDVRMLPPIRPGIHKLELKDYGIRLQLNTTYQWKIIVQGNTPGESYSTSGWIMRVSPPTNVAALTRFPAVNSLPPRPLIEAGLWYDAIWALSERIQSNTADTASLNQRANLFEQVGLLPPAQHDRAHLPAP
jgi:hypothetical protein